MENEATKAQIRNWLEKAIQEAQNPDPREKIRRERQQKMKKEQKRYGF